jgi:hypothetical protein
VKKCFQLSPIVIALLLFFAPISHALNIQILPGNGDFAPDDPGDAKMLFLMNAAAEYGEDIIEDAGTLAITNLLRDWRWRERGGGRR